MTWMFFVPSKPRYRAKIHIMVVSKTSGHIQIKIKMSNLSHDPPAYFKAPNEDLLGHGCSLHLQIQESQNLDHVCIKEQ